VPKTSSLTCRFLFSLLFSLPLFCADSQTESASGSQAPKEFSAAIEDNSFFIEEAYNQEEGVVQHIQTAMRHGWRKGDVDYSFTQEWPVFSPKHQFSYTIPASFPQLTSTGIGDVMIHYRYQLFDEKAHKIAAAPRISVIFPSGNVSKGLGNGSAGLQLYLPVSKRLAEKAVVHFNAGFTLLPRAQFESAQRTLRDRLHMYHLGGSAIWLAHKNANLMLEYLVNFASDFNDAGKPFRYQEHIVSPGLRFAVNVGSLQIVPGVAFPVRIRQGIKESGVFIYLSFEHPFKKIS
jgi:hypothetical protein